MTIYNEQHNLDYLHRLDISEDFISIDPDDKSVTVRLFDVRINENNYRGFLDVNKHFALSFMSVDDIIFEHNNMRGISSKLLQIRSSLEIRACNKLKELDLSNVYMLNTNNALVEIFSNQNLSRVDNIHGIGRLRCYVSSNPQLSNIGFKYPDTNVLSLNISKCEKFTSLKNITNGNIESFQIGAGVNLKTFDAHCASEIKHADICCNNIRSYRNIDKFIVKHSIVLRDMFDCENAINILLSKALVLNICVGDNCKNDSIEAILDRYIHYGKNRCDYIMDCTLDLLNVGAIGAAEL